MMRRRIIGRFKRSKQGGWEGEISTLAIQRQIRLVPNDDRASDRAPSFRVMLGWHQIGDAWERTSHSETRGFSRHSTSSSPRPRFSSAGTTNQNHAMRGGVRTIIVAKAC